MATKETVRVVATARGFDGTNTKEPGDEFDMPADVFDKREKKDPVTGKGTGAFYDAPTWFKPVEAKPAKAAEKKDGKDLV